MVLLLNLLEIPLIFLHEFQRTFLYGFLKRYVFIFFKKFLLESWKEGALLRENKERPAEISEENLRGIRKGSCKMKICLELDRMLKKISAGFSRSQKKFLEGFEKEFLRKIHLQKGGFLFQIFHLIFLRIFILRFC